MKNKKIRPVLTGVILIFSVASGVGQSLEQVVADWLQDAPSGFHNAFEKYGRGGNGFFNDIDYMTSSGWRSFSYAAGFELKPDGSLENTFDIYKAQIDNWELVKGWEKKIHPLPAHQISYRSEIGGQTREITLKMGQNYDASKASIVSVTVQWNNIKGKKIPVPDRDSKPEPSSGLVMSLMSIIASEPAQKEFIMLVGDADNDFENIIIHDSWNKGIYQIRESCLNPTSSTPFVHVEDNRQKRRLVIRFVQRNEDKAQYTFWDAHEAMGIETLLAPEWSFDGGDSWVAHPKTGHHKMCFKGVDRYGDFFVLEVTREDWRQLQTLGAKPADPSLAGQWNLAGRLASDICSRFEGQGFSVVAAANIPLSRLNDTDVNWRIHSGNQYGVVAISTDKNARLQFILKQDFQASDPPAGQTHTKILAEGSWNQGYAELTPDAVKIFGSRDCRLELKSGERVSPDACVCLVFAHKSKDNKSSSPYQNHAENYYSRQNDASFQKMENEILGDLRKELDKSRQFLENWNK